MKITIQNRFFSKNFRWIELGFWKKNKDSQILYLKLHVKIPLTFYTWKICWKGFPGSIWVYWKDV